VSAQTESSASASSARRAFSTPAAVALLIQFISFVLSIAIVTMASYWQYDINSLAAAIIQGIFAAGITYRKRLAPWWPPIQLAFPAAVVIVQSFQIPGFFFLGGFLVLLGIFWSTFRTQVPYYPSSVSVRNAVAALLPAAQPIHFIDIGSGLGGLLLELEKRRPESQFTGIELAPLPWLVSLLRGRLTGNRVRFLRGDYNRLNFSAYDAVFAYLSPAAMPALWEKARSEMKEGSLLLSYEFEIPEKQADWISGPDEYGRHLYIWHM
jgi:SAM-dependent methyltransferase